MTLKDIQTKLDDVRAMLEELSDDLCLDDVDVEDRLYVDIGDWLAEIHHIDIAMSNYTDEE